VGGRLHGELGRVTFLDQCGGLDLGGTHLVLETGKGRVAVLLLPGADALPAASVAHGGRTARVLSAARGMVGVVGESAEDVSHAIRLLDAAMEWRRPRERG
jgi:hypothetical protein